MKADRQRIVETDLGWLGLVASPKGLKAVLGPRTSRAEIDAESLETFGKIPDDRDESLSGLRSLLERYARGERVSLKWPLDMESGTLFQQDVWRALLTIPSGEVMTYGQIAAAVGKPGAARAVGQAVGSNPFSIVVPCHRVVGSDGALTGFGGGLATKERLLLGEGRADASHQRERTEQRKNFKPTLRERGLRKKAGKTG